MENNIQPINQPENQLTNTTQSVPQTPKKFPINLLILVIAIAVMLSAVGVIYFEQKHHTKLATAPTLISQKGAVTTPTSSIPTSPYKVSLELVTSTKVPYYAVKRMDLKTGKTEIIYKIKYFQIYVQAGFGKDKIDQFIISPDQKMIAYAATEQQGADTKNPVFNQTIHILRTDIVQDSVIYTEKADMIQVLSGIKTPLFFTNDDKKLIVIGYTSGEVPNKGVYLLNPFITQNSLIELSKNQISKFPMLSPSGNYLLLETAAQNYENSVVTSGTVDLTLYSLDSQRMSFHNLFKVNPPPHDVILEFWDPSFISDHEIIISTTVQFLVVNAQKNTITDITQKAMESIAANYKYLVDPYYDSTRGKIVYAVSDSISSSPQAPYYAINIDGSGREKILTQVRGK